MQTLTLDRNAALTHRLEEGRLGLRSRAVDLIGENDVGEQGSFGEMEILGLPPVDRHADDVRRKQIAGELDPLEVQPQRARQRLRESRLADSWNVFDQHVAASQHCDDGQSYGLRLAPYDGGHRRLEAAQDGSSVIFPTQNTRCLRHQDLPELASCGRPRRGAAISPYPYSSKRRIIAEHAPSRTPCSAPVLSAVDRPLARTQRLSYSRYSPRSPAGIGTLTSTWKPSPS